MESHKKKDVPVLNAIKDCYDRYYVGLYYSLDQAQNDNDRAKIWDEYHRDAKTDLFDSISEIIYKDFIDREDRFQRIETDRT